MQLRTTIVMIGLLGCFWVSAQITIDLPPIEGAPRENSAPPGWSIWTVSPDIIQGNGLWPSGTYTVEDVDGGNISGKSMGLFLCNKNDSGEGWETTLSGLKIGQVYSVSLKWQQATLTDYSSIVYSGGDLLMVVDGDSTIFSSNGGISDDWQKATVRFEAKSNAVSFQIKVSEVKGGSVGVYGSAIVVDNATIKEPAKPPAPPY